MIIVHCATFNYFDNRHKATNNCTSHETVDKGKKNSDILKQELIILACALCFTTYHIFIKKIVEI